MGTNLRLLISMSQIQWRHRPRDRTLSTFESPSHLVNWPKFWIPNIGFGFSSWQRKTDYSPSVFQNNNSLCLSFRVKPFIYHFGRRWPVLSQRLEISRTEAIPSGCVFMVLICGTPSSRLLAAKLEISLFQHHFFPKFNQEMTRVVGKKSIDVWK